jgi:hypothetical protein
MNSPSQIWICAQGKDLPEWIEERLTSDVAPDGTFEIEASDGLIRVDRGFAVFVFNDQVFACPPKLVQEKLAAAAGADNEIVAELGQKTEAMKAQKAAHKAAHRVKATGSQPLRLKSMIGSPPTPAFCLVDNLQVDDSYQRSIEGGASQKLIVKIAENWDWRLCLPLLVSRRQGQLYVIDGQHRLEAARLRGDIRDIPVVVFDFDDPKAEAELFVQANRARRPMQKLDDFHADLAAGGAESVAVNKVITDAGLTVGRNGAWQLIKPGEVVFVQAVKRGMKSFGPQTATRALRMMAQAFPDSPLVTGAAIFEGLCTFMSETGKSGGSVDDDLMTLVLSETGIAGWKELVAGAETGFDRADMMLSAIRAAYEEAGAQ